MKTLNIALAALVAALAASTALAAGQTPTPRAPEGEGLVAGWRGLTLPLGGDQVAFVKKGDYVDVLVTFDAAFEAGIKEKVTATILQYVRVVDVKQPGKLSEKGAVQVLVNPHEAQYAALGSHSGELQLLVRARGDKELKPQEMAAFRKLFGK